MRNYDTSKDAYIKTYYHDYKTNKGGTETLPQINEEFLDTNFDIGDFKSHSKSFSSSKVHSTNGMIARSRFASDYATKSAIKHAVNSQVSEALLDNFSGIGSKLTGVMPLQSVTIKDKVLNSNTGSKEELVVDESTLRKPSLSMIRPPPRAQSVLDALVSSGSKAYLNQYETEDGRSHYSINSQLIRREIHK